MRIRNSSGAGYTLIEMLIVIAILGIAVSIVSLNFSASRGRHELNNDTDAVVSLINEARSRTLAGDSGSAYGIHVESSKAVLFSGATFAADATGNKEVMMDSGIEIATIDLAGGAADIFFKKLTGDTDQYGTLVVERTAEPSDHRTISIEKTGLVNSD